MTTTKLNKNTKKADYYKRLYNMADCSSVDGFYNNPSYTKRQIEKTIREKMIDNDCINYRVLCGNSSFFTCGYTSRNRKTLYIETSGNTFEIEL